MTPLPATLGDWIHQILSEEVAELLVWQQTVNQTQDPEAIHQLRVHLRRLRSALAMVAAAVTLPCLHLRRNLRTVARQMGQVRDLDVLCEILSQTYAPDLPPAEHKPLQKVLRGLQGDRHHHFATALKSLEQKKYRRSLQTLQQWLAHPTYSPVAAWPLTTALPDLLLPTVSHLLLEPGWRIAPTTDPQSHLALHDLRKTIKGVRYQIEFLPKPLVAPLKPCLKLLRQGQDLLGQMQDSVVLEAVVTHYLGAPLGKVCPQLAQRLQATRQQCWQAWQPIQNQFCQHGFRESLREQINSLAQAKAVNQRRTLQSAPHSSPV